MKTFFTYLFFFGTIMFGFAQGATEFKLIEKIPLKAEHFAGTDNFGALYYIEKRTLIKQTQTETYNFKDFQLGNIGSVDLLNPLKITLFYPDYNTAVILDNKLNEIQRVSFAMEPPFLNIINATTANENRLWVFNNDSQQIQLYNYRNEVLQNLSRPFSETYITHKSNYNFCYVLTDQKLRLYNIYGSLLHSIPSEGIQKIALSNDKLVVLRNNALILLAENLTVEKPVKPSELTIKDLFLSDEFLYIYDGEFIHKIKLTKTP